MGDTNGDSLAITAILVCAFLSLFLSFLVAKAATRRGCSFKHYFWLSFFLSPLVGWIILISTTQTGSNNENIVTLSNTFSSSTIVVPQPKIDVRPPSADLPQFRTGVFDMGDSLELTGRWLNECFPGKESIQVMKQGNLLAFLDQTENRFAWTWAYLHHPDPEMVAQTLAAAAPITQLALTVDLAYLLTHGDDKIEAVASHAFWPALAESGIEIVLNALASFGLMPSGIDTERAKLAVQRIHSLCPTDYPPAKKAKFIDLARERFGPSVIQDSAILNKPAAKPMVTFKETSHSQNHLGQTNTYEVYTSPSKADALAFLESKSITQPLFAIVVETPEGNWSKDKGGFYQE
jgi:hypothetical protein